MSERDLRDAFRELRRADQKRAPGFEQTLAAARSLPPAVGRARWRLAAAATVAAALALWLVPFGEGHVALPDASLDSLGSWATPTDALLETPGRDLLRDLPDWEIRPDSEATQGSYGPGAATSWRVHV